MLVLECVNKLLIHAVGGAQMKFAFAPRRTRLKPIADPASITGSLRRNSAYAWRYVVHRGDAEFPVVIKRKDAEISFAKTCTFAKMV